MSDGAMRAAQIEPAAPLGDIEIGLSVEQAQAVVDEIAALCRHASHDGKKKVHVLNVLSNTLIRELAAIRGQGVIT